ncbi:MAG: hypothetical protein ACI8XM_001395, partial [Haloarculaceae archaeon]
MNVRVSDDTSADQAQAIAQALADLFESDVTVATEGGDELGSASSSASSSPSHGASSGTAASPPPEFDDDLGPTEREEELWAEIEDI